MLKIRPRATALASVLPFTIIGFTACSSDPAAPGESVGSATQAAISVGNGTTCRVELTKVNYDEPGTDTGNFVEIHVVRDSGSAATTFGECGLGKVQHVNGGNSCASVWVVDVSAMTIPNDDYLVICGKDGIATSKTLCDVTTPTSGSIGTDLLQSGPDDIYFFDTADNLILDARYENGSDCTNSATQIQLQAEDGNAPDKTNVACNDAFTLVDTSTVTLRQAYACPVSDAGTDAAGGAGGSTGGTGGAAGGTGGSAATGGTGATATGGTGATGATGGTGATTGTGGTVGTGATGGSTGTGATGGTGATTGTGGSVGTGATGGTGGTSATGGSAGTSSGTGGSSGIGGTSATGGTGATGTGGSAGAGATGGSGGTGATGTGGTSSGTGGSAGSAGTGGTAGSSGNGGTGGTSGGTGGAATGGTGGAATGGTGGAATGGSSGNTTGGSAGNAGSAGDGFGGAGGFVGDGGVEPAPRFKVPDDDSCSCSVPGSPSNGVPNGMLAGLLGLGAVILRRRRRS